MPFEKQDEFYFPKYDEEGREIIHREMINHDNWVEIARKISDNKAVLLGITADEINAEIDFINNQDTEEMHDPNIRNKLSDKRPEA